MDEHDKKLLAGVLAKYYRFILEKERDEKLLKEMNERVKVSNDQMENYRATFKLFGFPIISNEMWKEVSNSLGKEVYDEALTEGKDMFNQANNVASPPEQKLITAEPNTIQNSTEERPKIRELVLAQLEGAGGDGDGATSIRKRLEERWQIKLHEKTIGMTLYRLSKDGLARREGRKWFFVPQPAETKNPGDDAPGQLEVLN